MTRRRRYLVPETVQAALWLEDPQTNHLGTVDSSNMTLVSGEPLVCRMKHHVENQSLPLQKQDLSYVYVV